MNLSILADLRGVIPQVEHTGTPKLGDGVPTPKGYECNKYAELSVTEHQEHPEHPKIVVTEKSSEVEAMQYHIPQAEPATQQKRKSGKSKRQKEPVEKAEIPPQIQVSLELGDTMRSGITGKYGPV